MQFSKLFNDDGEMIDDPTVVPTSVSWDARDGVAQAWTPDGLHLIAEMHAARVVQISMYGMRIEGMEPINVSRNKFRVMSWFVRF